MTNEEFQAIGKRIDAAKKRWADAAHAMQSGVAYEMNLPERVSATEPKHLRVGVNAALADHGSLVRLLIAKGVFTEVEYLEAIATGMEAEVVDYEAGIKAHTGVDIKLR